jgi:hypothetical protein
MVLLVSFTVSNRLVERFMNKRDLSELVDSGWEVGSRSMTHTNLVNNQVCPSGNPPVVS